MNKLLIASLGALVLGCEEPKFEGELNTYAPACDNKPYVTAGFDGFTIKCGEYYFEHQKTSLDGEDRLEKTVPPCITTWVDNDCDGTADYWALSCREYDEEGSLINVSDSFSRHLTDEQEQGYTDSLKNIGYEAAEANWIEWNIQ